MKQYPKFVFYLIGIMRNALPSSLFRNRRERIINAEKAKSEHIKHRVDYCNKMTSSQYLSDEAQMIKDFELVKPSAYYYDLKQYLLYFDGHKSFEYIFGDVIHVPDFPTIVKSRPIGDHNVNSILLNLNKRRHFQFVNDTLPFHNKKDMLVWRGNLQQNQTSRRDFLVKYYGKTYCDAGHVNTIEGGQWQVPALSVAEQLQYKFILSIEGNDVATNLKWIMSSNSLCFMCSPKYETWFMEGTLIPDYHYVLLKDDFSDLEGKVKYYTDNTAEASEIVKNANAYVNTFKTAGDERLISLLILEKYFKFTKQ